MGEFAAIKISFPSADILCDVAHAVEHTIPSCVVRLVLSVVLCSAYGVLRTFITTLSATSMHSLSEVPNVLSVSLKRICQPIFAPHSVANAKPYAISDLVCVQ